MGMFIQLIVMVGGLAVGMVGCMVVEELVGGLLLLGTNDWGLWGEVAISVAMAIGGGKC